MITGGAIGNLADRLRSPRGVVDFIDMGLGDYRFWTFNVADVGVTIGASLLLYTLLRRSRQEEPEPT
jgi:signal peptidase II